MKTFVLLFLCLSSFATKLSFAHDGKSHKKKDNHAEVKKVEVADENLSGEKNKIINELYIENVRPIFVTKCFNCHGSKTNFPWYYSLPLVKNMINHDIKEAKEHIDMSDDFPFKGHGTPKEDILAIKKSAIKDSMPPFAYNIMHRNHRLNKDDQLKMIEWAEKSLEILNK